MSAKCRSKYIAESCVICGTTRLSILSNVNSLWFLAVKNEFFFFVSRDVRNRFLFVSVRFQFGLKKTLIRYGMS